MLRQSFQGDHAFPEGWRSQLKQRRDANRNGAAEDDDDQINFPPLSRCGIIASNSEGTGNMAPQPIDDSTPSHGCGSIGTVPALLGTALVLVAGSGVMTTRRHGSPTGHSPALIIGSIGAHWQSHAGRLF